MVGERVESRPAPPVGAVLWGLVTAGLFVLAAATGSPHPAVFAAEPAAVGLALWLTRPGRFAADVTATGLVIDDPPFTLPYDAIEGLLIDGRPARPGGMRLVHAGGVVTVPARLSVPSDEFYE